MRNSLIATGLVISALGATVCASVAATPTQAAKVGACFMPSDVRTWKDGGNDTLNVNAGFKGEIYNMRLLGVGCDQADWANSLGIRSTFGIRICEGDTAVVTVPQSLQRPATCRADKIRKLTPEEVAALPKANRP